MRVRPIAISALLAAFASLALAGPAGASREIVVYLTKGGFSPKSSTITVGDRVRFTVRDHRPHQVAKTSGPDADRLSQAASNSISLRELPSTTSSGQSHFTMSRMRAFSAPSVFMMT